MTKTLSSGAKSLPVLILLLFFFSVFKCAAQTDTLFINNEKVPCMVTEVAPDMVRFVLPGEQALNSIYRTSIQKIIFKSGRVQTFPEANYYKKIASVRDYDMVTIASSEDDVMSLHQVAEVASKSFGTVAYSSAEVVRDRAYQRLKVEAAMFGANMVLVTAQHPNGSDLAEGSAPSYELTGIVYASTLPDYEKFKKLIAGKNNLSTTDFYKLDQFTFNGTLVHDADTKAFKIYNLKSENGIVKIDADLEGEKKAHTFQLVSFDDAGFNIAYMFNNTTHNIRVVW